MIRGSLGWGVRIVAWLVIVGVSAILVIAVGIPRIAGATPYTVATGSMRPQLPAGTLVVVKPVEVSEIGVGQVITYQLRSGRASVVTHRVVGVGVDSRGEQRFQTQGDANDTADLEWVRPVQVRGAAWYSVPYLGHLNTALPAQQRQVLVYLVSAVLLGYACFMLASSVADRRVRRRASP